MGDKETEPFFIFDPTSGKRVYFEAKLSITFGEIKKIIQEKEGIPAEKQKLVLFGKLQEDHVVYKEALGENHHHPNNLTLVTSSSPE